MTYKEIFNQKVKKKKIKKFLPAQAAEQKSYFFNYFIQIF